MSAKTGQGNHFEDFALGATLAHAPPRTVTEGDRALYTALTGSRFALNCGETLARDLGLPAAPLDDLLVFHVVFGKTVPEISRNAIANLGYAHGRFLGFVYPGDTLSAASEVIGLRETSNRQSGVVHVRSVGRNQRGEPVLEYVRWVMVRKKDPGSPAPDPVVPELADALAPEALTVPEGLDCRGFDTSLSGSPYLWEDYEAGERIDHVDGMTLEEAEHQMATRLYHNTARVHFDQHMQKDSRFGRRLVYGGHVISLARALTFNGLGNAIRIAAINGGTHAGPTFAGDTLHAWSEVLDKAELPGRGDLGMLRLRTVAVKDLPSGEFAHRTAEGGYRPEVVLDLDYSVLVPRCRREGV